MTSINIIVTRTDSSQRTLLFNTMAIYKRWLDVDLSRYYKQQLTYYIYSLYYNEYIESKVINEFTFIYYTYGYFYE